MRKYEIRFKMYFIDRDKDKEYYGEMASPSELLLYQINGPTMKR